MAVQLLLLSGRTAGLFRAAILQSGPVLSAFSHSDKHPAYYGRTFAAAVGCPPEESSAAIMACLQDRDLATLVRHTRILDNEDKVMVNAPNPWKPILDGHFLPIESAFLPADPLDLLRSGNFNDIPIIIGHTKDEGVYAVTEILSRTPDAVDTVFRDWPHTKGPSYIFGREEEDIIEVESEIAAEFLSLFLDGGASREPRVLQNWFSPSVWTAATLLTTELLVRGKQTPTYQYYYTHPGSLTLADLLGFPLYKLVLKYLAAKVNLDLFPNSLNCSTHFDEIFLLFKGRNIPFLQRHTVDDRIVSDKMLKLWTNFAKTGKPTLKEDDKIWDAVSVDEAKKVLEIGTNTLTMKDYKTFEPVVKFWKKVWEKAPPRLHLWRSETWSNSSLYARHLSHNIDEL